MIKFSDLKLDPKVLSAVVEAGYETPTPIQEQAIPPALEGKDVLGIAQTGTGKTASFTLPMLTLLRRGRARARMPRSLVLAPTRELAAQVAENFDLYAKNTKLTRALLIGGVSFGEQDKLIDKGVDVLIATPGRLLDHFERGKLILTDVKIMVVDEADRMLDMGFIPDIERIFQLTPFTRQTLFFSATMAPEIERITNTFLQAPVRVEVARQATTSNNIEQRLVEIAPPRKDQNAKVKRELLRALLNSEGAACTNAIVFCNRKVDVDIVSKSLQKYGFDAQPIHGDLEQSHRTKTLDAFRDGSLKILVASDVAARGLDVPAVSHVFNYDLPSHAEDYVHRIGRTGRAGRHGVAYSIAVPSDDKYLSQIENLVEQTLPRVPLPAGFELSSAASQPPRPRDGDDNKGGRGGRGNRNKPRNSSGHAHIVDHGQEAATQPFEVKETPKPVAAVDVPSAPKAEPSPAPKPDAPRAETKEIPLPESPSQPNRYERQNSGRGSRGRRDNGPDVVGMGDHVPDFMLREFKIAKPKSSRKDDDAEDLDTDDTPQAVAAQAQASDATKDAPSETESVKKEPAKKPRRSRAAKPKAEPAAAAAAPEGEPATASAQAPATDEAEAKPKPKRTRTRTRKPAAPKAAATSDATEQPATPQAEAPATNEGSSAPADSAPAPSDADTATNS
ncbi:DEAD/DEAH box helicase [Rhodobacteraceae bacterium]|nr:DEAD/DEAH box helicase [Paracoccaceae bacterium]